MYLTQEQPKSPKKKQCIFHKKIKWYGDLKSVPFFYSVGDFVKNKFIESIFFFFKVGYA